MPNSNKEWYKLGDYINKTMLDNKTPKIISCPSCGTIWNTLLHNACQCGATIENTNKDSICSCKNPLRFSDNDKLSDYCGTCYKKIKHGY